MPSIGAINELPVFGVADAQLKPEPTKKEDFLNLLVAQMKYQDPLNPLEGSEFAAQLAQFLSLEELQNIGGKMDSQAEANLMLAQSVNNTIATTLIGKTVRAADDKVVFDGIEDVPLNYNLSGLASPVRINVQTEDGVTIRSLSIPNGAAGDNNTVWDGRDNRGNRVPPGSYRFTVEGVSPSGGRVLAMPLAIGRIEGVRFANGQPVLMMNGREVSFGTVLEILESAAQGEANNRGLLSRILEAGI